MALVLAGLLWAGMAIRAVGFSAWWFWVALLVTAGLWIWRGRPNSRAVASAILPLALIFGFTTQSSQLNPQLTQTAEAFTTIKLELSSEGTERFGRVPVRILGAPESPNQDLKGFGTLILKEQLPDCGSWGFIGDFLITPPTEKPVSNNQVTLRAAGPVQIRCLNNGLDWMQELGSEARHKTAVAVTGVSKDSEALVLGLTDGDTQLLSDRLNLKLKFLSLTHLNAVSGANCAIVVSAVFGILAMLRLGRRTRVIGSLGALACYLLLVGNQPSVIRAAGMACIALVSLASGRRSLGQNVLAAAICLLLAVWPELALNFGFALSALATWGVIALAPAINLRLKSLMPSWLALMVAVSIGAQIACLPVLVLLQSRFSVFSTLANILVEPAVPIITVFGVLGALLAQFWAPLAAIPFWLASLPAQYLVSVANWLGGIPASITWQSGLLGVAGALGLAGGVAWFVLARGRVRFAGLALALALTVGLTSSTVSALWRTSQFATGDWFWVSCDVGQGDASVIRSQGQVAVIDAGRDPEPINSCLNRLGIHRINLLVLTHFDLDHVGGLSGAIAGRQVDQALLSDFQDDRPGAKITESIIQSAGIPSKHVSAGLTGRLGSFSWLVLSPHLHGADSVDSNDGSVTMFFHSSQVNLITLADLPESGQQRLASERQTWWSPDFRKQPLIMKVSHHGSADQFPEFIDWIHPQVALFSVGAKNSYGHPTQRTLRLLAGTGALILRTDLQGSLSISNSPKGLVWGSSGAGG